MESVWGTHGPPQRFREEESSRLVRERSLPHVHAGHVRCNIMLFCDCTSKSPKCLKATRCPLPIRHSSSFSKNYPLPLDCSQLSITHNPLRHGCWIRTPEVNMMTRDVAFRNPVFVKKSEPIAATPIRAGKVYKM